MILYNFPAFYKITTNDIMFDFLIIFILISVFSTFGGIFLGYLFGPLYLLFHRKVMGRKMLYGVRTKSNSENLKGGFIKLFYPALMIMNFSFMFHANPLIQGLFLSATTPDTLVTILAITWLFPWVSIFGLGLFSGAYFLSEAGIIYSNKKQVKDDPRPVEMRSVGNYYIQFLKGFAGITIFLNLYELLSGFLYLLGEPASFTAGLILLSTWPFMPFLIAFLMIPAMIGLDITFERRKKFMLRLAEKMGITGMIDDPLDQA